MNTIDRTVFVIFIKNDKLLVVKSVRSAKQNLYTLIGGSLLENEDLLEGAIRECKEEINQDLSIKRRDFIELFKFNEYAASDPNLLIEMNILYSKKEIDIDIKPDLEILDYKWIDVDNQELNLSSAITNYVFPWMREGSYKK